VANNSLRDKLSSLINHVYRKLNVGVGTKIFLSFFTVTFLIIGLISYFVMDKISEKISQMDERRATVILNTTIEMFNDQKNSLEINARLLADSPQLEKAMTEKNSRLIYEILAPSKYYSGYSKLLVYDRNRNLVVKLSEPSKWNEQEDEAVKQALTGLTVSHFEVTENGLELYTVTPIHFDPTKYSSRMPAGALLVDNHIGDSELIEIKNRTDVDINIIFDGRIVASTLDKSMRHRILPGLLNSIKRGERFQVVDKGERTGYVNAWSNIGDQGGIIAVTVPNDDLLAIIGALSRDIKTITVLAGILVLGSSYLLAKIIIRPLVKVLNITTAITHGDFSQRIKVVTRDEFGRLCEAVNYMADKIKERLEEAEHLATVDGLTGIFNHRYFQQRLQQELDKAKRSGTPLSLVMIDIDYFKHYNDTLGHPAGDRVLHTISQLICKNIRGVDIPARYGGEEFALILVDTTPKEAMQIGERIRKEIEAFPFEGREIQPSGKVTVSMGVASYPVNATRKEDLIRMADDALYKAKYISKNKVVLYYSVLDELKGDLDQSEHDLLNTIKTLISVINSKDRYTFGHSERVVKYAVRIAEVLNLTEREIKIIKVGGFLHDIGKIEIDRELLNKEDSLDQEELKVLKQHPTWGAQIVSSLKSLQDIVPAILYHHESFDGTGYPFGIKGNDIPLIARILKVADSFDAMTTARPYQQKKSFAEAREELMNHAGTEFDPQVVEVFLKVLDEPDFNIEKMVS